MSYCCQLGQLVPRAQFARYVLSSPNGPIGSTGPIGAICLNELLLIEPIGSIGPISALCTIYANWAIGSMGPIGAICPNELVPIGPIGSTGPIGAICPIVANWANRFHGPNWRDMYYVCQMGQLVPRAQFVKYVSMNYCQMGHLVPSAQLARYVLFMPIGPIGSTGPIGAICPNELVPNGPIGSTGPIGAICPIVANWANRFHGPNWRDMYYVCQMGQLVPRAQFVKYVSMNYCQMGHLVPSAQLARYVLFMPIGPIGSTGPIGAICPNELVPNGPIGSTGPIGAICRIVANWANRFHGPNWRDMYYVCQMGQLVPRAQFVKYVSMNYCQIGHLVPSAQSARYVLLMPIVPIGSTGPIGAICPN